MRSYLGLIEDVLDFGEEKANRTGITTSVSFPSFFEHDMQKGFPLLTTKKMSLKNIATELEFFIGGYTDKKWLKQRGCNIWNEWANPEVLSVEIQSSGNGDLPPSEIRDLGPIYGYQWRRFGKLYENGQYNSIPFQPLWDDPCDQLANAIWKLKNNPDDRRMVISAWNPKQIGQMALPPCHYSFVLQHINGKLSLNWSQRSVDMGLGLPYNIASYGLLLELICADVGMTPYKLSGNLVDCHIYENHLVKLRKQINLEPHKLPRLEVPKKSIFSWTRDQFELINYTHHPKISLDIAV